MYKHISFHPIFYCVFSFVGGILITQLFEGAVLIAIGVGILLIVLYVQHRKYIFVLMALFFIIGFVRAEVWDHLYATHTLEVGEVATFGYVSREPEIKDTHSRLVMTIDTSHERVLVTTMKYPEITYGDYLHISGELELPAPFETDTGRTFNYDTFLKKDKIYYTMRYPEVRIISRGTHGNYLTTFLLALKARLVLQIQKYLPEPHSSLLAGLLVGAKSSLGEELLDDLRTTGVIHIVVLSGFNVTIIAEAIMRVLAFLGLVGSSIAGSVAILFFTIMTGASATVVRAALMAFLVLLARATGYHSEITRALFVAGLVMIFHNPMILLYDPSFQLSFLATLGLIVLVPWIETKLIWIPKTAFDFRGLAAASLGTQLFVLPMLIWMTGEISFVSPLVNILVLWVVPFTMLIGFIMIIASVLSSVLVIPIMTVAWFLLGYILTIVQWFAKIPFASIHVPAISVASLILMYAVYIAIWLYNKEIWKNK